MHFLSLSLSQSSFTLFVSFLEWVSFAIIFTMYVLRFIGKGFEDRRTSVCTGFVYFDYVQRLYWSEQHYSINMILFKAFNKIRNLKKKKKIAEFAPN